MVYGSIKIITFITIFSLVHWSWTPLRFQYFNFKFQISVTLQLICPGICLSRRVAADLACHTQPLRHQACQLPPVLSHIWKKKMAMGKDSCSQHLLNVVSCPINQAVLIKVIKWLTSVCSKVRCIVLAWEYCYLWNEVVVQFLKIIAGFLLFFLMQEENGHYC